MTEYIVILVFATFAAGFVAGLMLADRFDLIIPRKLLQEPAAVDQTETIDQIAAKLDAWRAKHPQEQIKRLGWALIEIATESGRAEKQIAQALNKPGDKREEQEARAAYGRLRASVEAYNLDAAIARDVSRQ